MSFVKAQCENCNGILTVDSAKRAAICPYCQTPYVVQDAINYYSTNIGVLNAENVNIYNSESKEKLLKNAEMYYSLGEYKRAREAYGELIKHYPEESAGWWGIYKCGVKTSQYFHELETTYKRYAINAMKLGDYAEEYNQIWKEFENEYKQSLHFVDNRDNFWHNFSNKDIELILYTKISDDNPYLKRMRDSACENYRIAFTKGLVSFLYAVSSYGVSSIWENREIRCPGAQDINETCKLEDIPVLMRILDEGSRNAESIIDHQYRHISFLKGHVKYASSGWSDKSGGRNKYVWGHHINRCSTEQMEQSAQCFPWDKFYRIKFILGKTIIVENRWKDMDSLGGYRLEYHVLLTDKCISTEEINNAIVKQWKLNKLCPYCGGSIRRGLFSSKCEKCRKKIDY